MKHVVRAVSPDTLDENMEQLLPLLERAHKYTDEYSVEDSIKTIKEGGSFLFTIDDTEELKGVAIVELEKHPQREYLLIHMLGGYDMTSWVEELRDRMKDFATHMSLDGVVIYGRKGWTKIFKDLQVERIMMIDKVEK